MSAAVDAIYRAMSGETLESNKRKRTVRAIPTP